MASLLHSYSPIIADNQNNYKINDKLGVFYITHKMSSYRSRESTRGRLKLSKNLARLYKSANCRKCSVVVTNMDFAKILGKFTKVKIQYESSTTPKSKVQIKSQVPPISNARLKSNENGMVLIHRTAYNQHPVKVYDTKRQKETKIVNNTSPKQPSNILKENNRLKKTPIIKDQNSNYNKNNKLKFYSKQYGIIFESPKMDNNEIKNKISLSELLPLINKSILPSEEWGIDYFPKEEEPKEDQVYDRIAAELEDLMYNKKIVSDKVEVVDNKVDEFPSILDILNENPSEIKNENDKNVSVVSDEFKTNLESNVEAMLLGETEEGKSSDTIPMDVGQSDVNKLVEYVEPISNAENNVQKSTDTHELCSSPSILDESAGCLKEHSPIKSNHIEKPEISAKSDSVSQEVVNTNLEKMQLTNNNKDETVKKESSEREDSVNTQVSHIVFKQMKNGNCCRSVICPKSLKYSIELEGKAVELLGAPKFISSLEDLKVLLQIVNESGLNSFYVLH